MLHFVYINRVHDRLALCAASSDDRGLEKELQEYKSQAKDLIATLSSTSAPRGTVRAGPFDFHYLAENDVCFLVCSDRSFPKKLAFVFLGDMQTEFMKRYGASVATASVSYEFIKFDTVVDKMRADYADVRSTANVDRLNAELSSIHAIMTTNIEDALGRGKRLDEVQDLAAQLAAGSKVYAKDTQYLKWLAMYRKWGPILVVVVVILLLIYMKFWWFA